MSWQPSLANVESNLQAYVPGPRRPRNVRVARSHQALIDAIAERERRELHESFQAQIERLHRSHF
jgi:hypothetical protein